MYSKEEKRKIVMAFFQIIDGKWVKENDENSYQVFYNGENYYIRFEEELMFVHNESYERDVENHPEKEKMVYVIGKNGKIDLKNGCIIREKILGTRSILFEFCRDVGILFIQLKERDNMIACTYEIKPDSKDLLNEKLILAEDILFFDNYKIEDKMQNINLLLNTFLEVKGIMGYKESFSN